MKTILVMILISGILLGVQALRCHQCMDIAYETNYDGARESLDSMLSAMETCESAWLSNPTCPEEEDECVTNIVSYKLAVGFVETSVTQVTKMCSSSLVVDKSVMCDTIRSSFESMGSMFQDLTCETEFCSTDGCNNQAAIVN
jgi:hypothetical protein